MSHIKFAHFEALIEPELSAYDWQESEREAAADRQIEHDQEQSGYAPESIPALPAGYFDNQHF